LGLSSLDLLLQGQAVVEQGSGGRGSVRHPAEQTCQEEQETGSRRAQPRLAPVGKGGKAHPFFCLGGFTTLAPTLLPWLIWFLRES
jgi:hypothetical protein